MSAVPANPTGAADPADEAEPLTTGQDDGNEPEVTDPADEAAVSYTHLTLPTKA